MCNSLFGGGNCSWVLILVIILLLCNNDCGSVLGNNGCGCNSGCNNDCGCGC